MNILTWRNAAIVMAIALVYIIFFKEKDNNDKPCKCKEKNDTEKE